MSVDNSGLYNAKNRETTNYIKQIMECIPDMKEKLADMEEDENDDGGSGKAIM